MRRLGVVPSGSGGSCGDSHSHRSAGADAAWRSPKLNLQPTLPLMHTQKLPRRACGRSSTQRCATSATLTPWRRATPDSAASRRCSQSQSPTSRTTLAYLLSEDVSRRTLRAHAEAHYINASTEEAQPF